MSSTSSSGLEVKVEEFRDNLKESSSASPENSPSALTINLRHEYTLALRTNSYNQIWRSLTHQPQVQAEAILRPDRASLDEAIRSTRPTPLTAAVSRYLESSEQAFHLLLSFSRSADLAREIYAPLLSPPPPQHDTNAFIDFDRQENPFKFAAGEPFGEIHDAFSALKPQLDLRLLESRRRHRLLRKATIASAACIMASVAGAVAAALVLASNALLAVSAVAPVGLCCGGRGLFAGTRRRLKEGVARADAAAREIYVLDKHLSTVERLVERLHGAVESDKALVRLGLERGRGQISHIEDVVRQLRKNRCGFRRQLTDLVKHVCLCMAAINHARYLLLQQLHSLRSTC